MDTTSKPTNPKDLIGASKLPLHLFPRTAVNLGCLGMLDGALKYGRSNFRAIGVRASIYVDAAQRHLDAWFEGEQLDPDSGVPHLGHALACIAILVDAEVKGNLNDDRQFPTHYREQVAQLTPEVERIKARHAHRAPKHYTIADGSSNVAGEPLKETGSRVAEAPPAIVTDYECTNLRCNMRGIPQERPFQWRMGPPRHIDPCVGCGSLLHFIPVADRRPHAHASGDQARTP